MRKYFLLDKTRNNTNHMLIVKLRKYWAWLKCSITKIIILEQMYIHGQLNVQTISFRALNFHWQTSGDQIRLFFSFFFFFKSLSTLVKVQLSYYVNILYGVWRKIIWSNWLRDINFPEHIIHFKMTNHQHNHGFVEIFKKIALIKIATLCNI